MLVAVLAFALFWLFAFILWRVARIVGSGGGAHAIIFGSKFVRRSRVE